MALLILLAFAGMVAYAFGLGIFQEDARLLSENIQKLFGRGKKTVQVVDAVFTTPAAPQPAAQPVALRVWAAGAGAALLPEEFTLWLASLSEEKAAAFQRALEVHAANLGYELGPLTRGEMDIVPERRRVFVESIVIYSHAYRKLAEETKEAPKKVEEAQGEANSASHQPAEKAVSRRKAEPDPAGAG